MPMNEADALKMKSLLGGEYGKLIQAYADTRVTDAIKTHDEKTLSFPKAEERLRKIEQAADARIRKLELENHAIRKAFEFGISVETIEGLGLTFTDEKDVDEKLSRLAEAVRVRKANELNEAMASGYRPSSGRSEPEPHEPFPGYGSLSPSEKLAAEFNERMGR